MNNVVPCPGCTYSGQPHLEGCQKRGPGYQFFRYVSEERAAFERAGADLREDELPVVTEYIRRFISSRTEVPVPKSS